MKRIKLVVAYDGTNYCGWQIQPNGVTIEEKLNQAIFSLTGEKVFVTGASRTDSGVHALGNLAVFDTETKIPPEKICYALNQRLPEDIVVLSSEETEASYHPRKCNSLKTYEYRIWNHRFPDPTRRLNTYHVHWPLDAEKMKQAAEYLKGEHDFASFCSAGCQAEDTIRTIYEASVEREGNLVTIRLTGNGFLYNMVRIIVGSLLEVGRGAWEPEQMKAVLEARDRERAGAKAPALGLTLMEISHLERLPEIEHHKNFRIDYSVYRGKQETEARVYLVIHCGDAKEAGRLILKNGKQAMRDGAVELWLAEDPEAVVLDEAMEGLKTEHKLEKREIVRMLPHLGEFEIWNVLKLEKSH